MHLVASLLLAALSPQDPGHSAPCTVTVVNPTPVLRRAIVTASVPYARGELRCAPAAGGREPVLAVTVGEGKDAAAAPAAVLMRWPDDSVAVLQAHFRAQVEPMASTKLAVRAQLDAQGMARPARDVEALRLEHASGLPQELPLRTELTDPWGRTFTARLVADASAGPDGIELDTGLVRTRRFRSLHALADGSTLLGLRAWLTTFHGEGRGELTLVLDNAELDGPALGPVRFAGFDLVVEGPTLAAYPLFANEQLLAEPTLLGDKGFRQPLLGPGRGLYLGDTTAKSFRFQLRTLEQEAGDEAPAAEPEALWDALRLHAFADLDRVRATRAFGIHGGPAPRTDSEPDASGERWSTWRMRARTGPFGSFGDPQDAAAGGTPRNGDSMLHEVLRLQSPRLAEAAEAMVLQHTLRPTPAVAQRPWALDESWRRGLGTIARAAPHGFVAEDYEHFSALLLFDWYWLTGDVLARAELARLGRGLMAILPVQPLRTSRGEGWCLQSGALVARATGDRALQQRLLDHALQVTLPLVMREGNLVAIAQPPHPHAFADQSWDAPWQMAALVRGLAALHAQTGNDSLRAAVLRVADAMAQTCWREGEGPHHFVSALDASRYTMATDASTQRLLHRMVSGAFTIAAGLADGDEAALLQRRAQWLELRLLPAGSSPRARAAAGSDPWLQVLLDRSAAGAR